MSDATSRLHAALQDRYRIERELGAGGMATVYLAEDLKHQRRVALKVLRPELSAVLGAERFLNEIRVTANLQHPHILPLFDSGEGGGFLYYVMPYVEGEPLDARLRREKQLGVEESVKIAGEVASALDYAHRHNVIHRDIKPANIMLQDGQALVADFGIALALRAAGGDRLTETGLSLGTPHYMSPEQATGDRGVDARSDIYSLGAVLYEMLAGEPPHTGNTVQAIISKLVTEDPRPVTDVRSTVPVHVAAAVEKSLARVPADRFHTAAEFAEALHNPAFTYGLPRTRAAAAARRPAPHPALRWAPWTVVVLAVVVALVGWMRRPATAIVGEPVRFYHASDSLHNIVSFCCGPPLAISPDGRRVAYEGAGVFVHVWVRSLDELEARQLPGTQGARMLFFSPEGEWVGYWSAGSLMKAPVSGGAPVRIAELRGTILGATWTADDHIVFGWVDSAGLFRTTADGGALERLTAADTAGGEAMHLWPHAVPGTDALLFTAWPRAGGLASAHVGFTRPGRGRVRAVSPGSMPQYAAGHLVSVRDGAVLMAQRFDPASGDTSGALVRLADRIITRAGGLGEVAISASGTMVVRSGEVGNMVSMVSFSGSETRVPLALPRVSHLDNPRFSPDGRRLLLAGFHDQESRHVGYLVDLARGANLRLTFDGNTEFLEWTPDGREVIYRKGDTLMSRHADRSGEEQVVLPPGGRNLFGRISVSGGWITFGVGREGATDLWAVRRGGPDSARAYLATPFDELAPALSPDGRWLAYVSNETGRQEVYVGSFPVPGGRETVSIEGGFEPQWARDGRTLYYRNDQGDFIAASLVPSGSAVSVASRRVVFRGSYERALNGAEYDVQPGAGRFVTFGTTGSGGRLVITLNAIR